MTKKEPIEDAVVEEKKPEPPPRRIISEARGKYTIIDVNRVYELGFPQDSSLAMNYDILGYLRDEIWKAMENEKKQEAEKKTEPEVKNES